MNADPNSPETEPSATPIFHYIPKSVLRRFRGKLLFELDIFTGKTPRGNIKESGADRGKWTQAIEDDLMTKNDTVASKIYHARIAGKHRIVLPSRMKWQFAKWVALFFPRTPQSGANISRMVDQARGDPEIAIQIMYKSPKRAIETIRQDSPEVYQATIASMGKYAGEAWLLAAAANNIRKRNVHVVPDPDFVRDTHLNTTRIDDFADLLCGFHWSWMYSRHGFLIGDNPLIRWQEISQNWTGGFLQDVEATLPLSTHLCLRLVRRKTLDRGCLMHCSRELTYEFNRRQRLAASAHLYAGTRQLLQEHAAARPYRPKRARKPDDGWGIWTVNQQR